MSKKKNWRIKQNILQLPARQRRLEQYHLFSRTVQSVLDDVSLKTPGLIMSILVITFYMQM